MPPRYNPAVAKTERDPAAEALDRLAARSQPGDLAKLDRQFTDKLARLEAERKLPADVLERLRTMWRMLKAPEDVVPWTAKAQIMAALTYLVSPIDVIPDAAGKAGYLDDAQVVKLVWLSLGEAVAAFQAREAAPR